VKIDLTELMRTVGNEADIRREARVNFTEDGLALTKPVKVSLHLINTGPSVLIDGTVETEAEVECSRCGKRFKSPLTAKLDEEYSRDIPEPAFKKGKEIELKEKDFVYPIGKDNTLDLDEILRQNLLLALPIQTLCEEEK
jgi:uncharacterized protein